ncbi:hypothetical protein AB5I41_19320 [Sphingomonas sp. MMS24-JH45]
MLVGRGVNPCPFSPTAADAVGPDATPDRLLRGINRIFRAALSAQSEEELAKLCLSVAEAITGAAFSFMGEFDRVGERLNDLSVSAACSATSSPWTIRLSRAANGAAHPRHLRPRPDRRGDADRERSRPNHPDRIGLPPGHPPLHRLPGRAAEARWRDDRDDRPWQFTAARPRAMPRRWRCWPPRSSTR